jgi:outer membrane protein OmpA-like peptidoglycan-associated protein
MAKLILQREESAGDDEPSPEPDKDPFPEPDPSQIKPGTPFDQGDVWVRLGLAQGSPNIEVDPGANPGSEPLRLSWKDITDFRELRRKRPNDCTVFPGFRLSTTAETKGECCKATDDPRDCCPPWRIGLVSLLESRCCRYDEFVADLICVKSTSIPGLPPLRPQRDERRLKLRPMTARPRLGVLESFVIDRFEVDSAELPMQGDKTLLTKVRHLARLLDTYREVEVHIEGHTDSSFTHEHNQKLSIRRAHAVETALRQRGVGRARMIVTGFGKERLLFSEERNAQEKARNRRVEVWFYLPPSQSVGADFRLRTPSLTP